MDIDDELYPKILKSSSKWKYGGNPFAKNAWYVDPVRDGITVYRLPNCDVIGAKVASLVVCERVLSASCEPRLDGLPNALLLRSPQGCASAPESKRLRGLSVHCLHGAPAPYTSFIDYINGVTTLNVAAALQNPISVG